MSDHVWSEYSKKFKDELHTQLNMAWVILHRRNEPTESDLFVHASEAWLARDIVWRNVPAFYGVRVIPYRKKNPC